MTSLTTKLSEIVGAVFEAQDLPKELGEVRISDRPDLAQFQCNGAMVAAKIAKTNPREIAQKIVDALQENEVFSKIDIAGPGFINLNLTDDYLANHLKDNEKDFGLQPIQEKSLTVLDYGGPNIAKAMHVGHLRAAIIGDALRRIMNFYGYETLGDVHMGDWGTHLGMLIGDYLREGEENLVLETDLTDKDQVQALMDDMAVRYPKASGAAKEDEALMQEARDITLKLQNKEEPYYGIWQKIREISVEGMKRTYGKLGVEFDLWKGEADVHDYIAPMVDDLKQKGHAIEDDGAIIVPIAANDDNKKIPPMILYKRDGAVMYGTTDCATIVERMKLYDPTRIVYIVDQRQSLHFEQVFRTVRKADIVPEPVELTHAGFGTMNGKDGKPFKTREGGVMRLEDLIEMAREKAVKRLTEADLAKDVSEDEFAEIAHKVAIAAIKFADLQNPRQADYIFDLDRLTSFEGKTGPYLLYQAVRIKSLLRKAKEKNFESGALNIDESDRSLALLLTEFSDAIDLSLRHYAPHHLCDYLFRLAQSYSSFYAACHIMSEENEELRASRLRISEITVSILEKGLEILGINTPERM
ncbi:MAG: arginine--tRNA ligase [Pseudomonadota bacterium]